MLVFTDYKPKLHDIEKLGHLASKIKAEMTTVFPRSTEEEKRLFELLQRAYIDARVRHDVSRCKFSHSEMGSRLYPIANQAVQG